MWKDATPALFTRSSSFTALGRSTHTGGWSCRSRRQSRGARGRSYNNRSPEIAGSAQPRLQRLNQAQVRGRQRWQWYCWPCPPGCNPVSTTHTTRTEDASPYIPKNSLHSGDRAQGQAWGHCSMRQLYSVRNARLGVKYWLQSTCATAASSRSQMTNHESPRTVFAAGS